MEFNITRRLQRAFNAFANRDPTRGYQSNGPGYSARPDRPRLSGGNERSIITAIFNRISLDVASIGFRHCKLDKDGRYIEDVDSELNNCLTLEANIDQTARSYIQDVTMSAMDEGGVAMVPVYTTADPMLTDSYDILSMRTGKILEWYPEKVLVQVYNERTGEKEDILLSKRQIGIVENPLYSIINEQNSTFKRLSRKLSLLDVTDERTASGKLDLLIQLPYAIKSEARRNQAETRRTDIEKQLTGSKYGIAYIDSTEKVVQLNRSLENNLMKQIEYLQDLLYSQLGITQEVLNGTADEKTMLNYMNRTVEPFVSAIADEMKRKFLSKTARTQSQSIMYFRDPFKLVPVSSVAEIADKFTRNEIMTANEIRQVIGMKPSKDPKADELRNSNISQAKEDLAETHKNQEGGDRGQNE